MATFNLKGGAPKVSAVEPSVAPVEPATERKVAQLQPRASVELPTRAAEEMPSEQGRDAYVSATGEAESMLNRVSPPAQIAAGGPGSFWGAVSKANGEEYTSTKPQKEVSPEQAIERPALRSGEVSYQLLGHVLKEQGLITEAQLIQALDVQAETYERIGAVLVRLGYVSKAQVDLAVAAQTKVRSLENVLRMLGLKVNHIRSSLMRIEKRGEAIQQVMRDTGYLSEEQVALALAALTGHQYFRADRVNKCKFAELISRGITLDSYSGYAPVALLDDRTLVIATEDVEHLNDAHNRFSEYPKKIYLIASARTLHRAYCTNFSRTEDALTKALREAEEIIQQRREQDAEGFVRRLIGLTLRHGCYSGASDIHLKESAHVATMSMRYDGVLKDVAVFGLELHKRLANLLSTDSPSNNTDPTQNIMREGSITFDNDEKVREEFKDIFDRYGFRLELGTAVRKTRTAVIRIIDSQGVTADLDNLGFDPATRRVVDQVIHSPDGLVLLVGPTGSGKTTTLYACMEEIDAEEYSIQTIENPVEGIHGKWMQFQVPHNSGQSEGAAMASIFKGQMRNDPDVILVGEIRDPEVADTAIQAAKTGHLVFSTLHVTRAAAVFTRLSGLQVERQDIADTLKAAIAQRLVRRLCSACAVPDTRDSTAERFQKPLQIFLQDVKQARYMSARDGGCVECRHTGYRGREMVYEVLHVTKKIRTLIERGATTSGIEEAAIPAGRSMFEVGLRLVANGITSIDELMRSVSDGSEA